MTVRIIEIAFIVAPLLCIVAWLIYYGPWFKFNRK